MRLFFVFAFVLALVVFGSQLNAGRPVTDQPLLPPEIQSQLVVGTSFPEPISTVYILGGAAALLLWYLARKYQIV